MKTDFHMHRSFGWIPLYEEPEPKLLDWTENVLIPNLEEITGIKWSRQRACVISNSTVIVLNHGDDQLRVENNPVIKAIIKKYYGADLRDIGYKLEKSVKDTAKYSVYEGYWVITIDHLKETVKRLSNRYGL